MKMADSPIKGVAEIVINVRDLSGMTTFYQEVLGFSFHSQGPDTDPTIVFLTIAQLDSPLGHGGHQQLFALIDPKRHIHRRDAYVGLDNQRSSLNHLAFEIDEPDFDTEKRRLEARGLTVRTREFPRMHAKALFFDDPEGNVIELICHNGDSE